MIEPTKNKKVNEFATKTMTKYNILQPNYLSTNHPHIVNNMMMFWGDKDFFNYTEKLLINETSRENRQGFSSTAFLEINTLIELHKHQFPQFVKKNNTDLYGYY